MREATTRAISGIFYVTIMCLGTIYYTSLLFIIIAIISLYEMWKLRKGKSKFIAFAYIMIPLFIIHLISDTELIIFMFIITWSFDTFAYIFGVQFGKNKILPKISPKKSWEGFIGGFVLSIIVSYLSYEYFDMFKSFTTPLIISLFIPITATIGDFIESYYKRKANVKDSGTFIPGHGGMLDRMDAFMITIPIIFILQKFLI